MSESLPDIRAHLLRSTVPILNDETDQFDDVSNRVPGLLAFYGSPAVPSIFPVVLEEAKPLPAITYELTALEQEKLLSGKGSGVKGFSLTLGCWALKYDVADQLSWAVREILDGYAGAMGSVKAVCLLEGVSEDYQAERKQYVRWCDFTIAVQN